MVVVDVVTVFLFVLIYLESRWDAEESSEALEMIMLQWLDTVICYARVKECGKFGMLEGLLPPLILSRENGNKANEDVDHVQLETN